MNPGIFDSIGGAYASATASWLGTLQPLAQRLFLLLATIELIWSGIWWAHARRHEEVVLSRILKKVVTLMFLFTVLLLAPTWIPTIIGSFVRAGQLASGFDSLDPSTVVQVGIDIAIAMFDSIDSVLALLKAPWWLFIAPIFVIFSFTVIAGVLLMTLIESYVVIGGGILLLGFAGSRWTVSFAEGYLVYAVRVGVKLFVLYLLIGIGMSLPQTWIQSASFSLWPNPRAFFEVMGGAMIFAMIIWRVPEFAASMLGDRAGFFLDRAFSDGSES